MRVVRNLVAFLFVLTGAAIVAAVLLLYLAATGRNLPMLRSVAEMLGRTLAGQQTTAMTLAVHVRPTARTLSGVAELSVRAPAGRNHLYFLLNDGLHVRSAWEEGANGERTALPALRLWLVTVVELPRGLASDEEVRIGIEYAGQPRGLSATGTTAVLEPDDVAIAPSALWYPADLQSFFPADVEVVLPAELTLVHNGHEINRSVEGTSTRVRFATEQPVAGLALVAGRYEEHGAERDGRHARVLLPPDTHLDAGRLLDALTISDQILAAHYGDDRFARISLFVNRRLPRAFNDGTGLIGIPPRYFTDGEYGFGIVAHEVAHNWWGATVTEQWLHPGTGGEWIVEGFAQFSGWRALREHLGEAALLRALAANFFDPDQTVALTAPSVLDNGLDPASRATTYNKGGYVAYMLAQRLGDERFDASARQFLDQFRLRAATATDLETVFSAAAQEDLASFFAAWVNGNESIDLALDPQEGAAAVRNHRSAPAPAELALWRFEANGEAPGKQTTTVGATAPIGSTARVVLDPLAAVADMYRSNNVLPRRDNPRAVARSVRGDVMVVAGEPYPWEPATIDVTGRGAGKAQSWAFDRGLIGDPIWSADGTRILAVESPRDGKPTLLALNVTDGSRTTIGHDTSATGTADATVVARGARLLRIAAGKTTALADHPGGRIVAPVAAPGGDGGIAYAVVWDSGTMDLRVLSAGTRDSRVLFTWPASPLRWRWSPDGTHLYAALAGDWDWQLWELSLDGTSPRALVREAAGIADLDVAPDGNHLALVARAEIDDPLERSEVFVIDRRSSAVQHFDLGGWTAFSATWLDDTSLGVVVADPRNPSLPVNKELRTLRLADGSLADFAK